MRRRATRQAELLEHVGDVGLDRRLAEPGAETRLIAGSAYDVIALLGATGLSVFKPRRRRSRPAA